VRACVGQAFAMYEMRIVLATIAERVVLEPEEKELPGVGNRGVFLGPDRPIRMRVKPKRRRPRSSSPPRERPSSDGDRLTAAE